MSVIGEAVILVPGFMGSRLSRPEPPQLIWLDPEWNLLHLQEAVDLLRLEGSDDRRLVADDILESVPLGAFSPQVYTPLLEFLTDPLKGADYPPENIHRFPFDWRLSIEGAAYDLDSKMGRWASRYRSERPFVVVAHSYGGLVAAHALFTGNHAPSRTALLITLGVPFAGLVKTLAAIRTADEVSDLPIAPNHVRDLIGDWPGSYDLMPYRERLGMVHNGSGRSLGAADAGITAPGFNQNLAAASRDRLRAHLVPLPENVEPDAPSPTLTPRPLPVPVRAIVGAGVETTIRAKVGANGRYQILKGIEGDGTTPVASALDFASSAPLGRRIYPIPYGHHVSLVKHPLTLRYLRTELRYGAAERYIVVATARSAILPAGVLNEVIVEVRDGEGNGLLDRYYPTFEFSQKVLVQESRSDVPLEANGRMYLRFRNPARPTRLTVRVPGLPSNVQPSPIIIAPA